MDSLSIHTRTLQFKWIQDNWVVVIFLPILLLLLWLPLPGTSFHYSKGDLEIIFLVASSSILVPMAWILLFDRSRPEEKYLSGNTVQSTQSPPVIRQLFKGLKYCLIYVNEVGFIERVNGDIKKLLGYEQNEMLEDALSTFFPQLGERGKESLLNQIRSGCEVHLIAIHKNGNPIACKVSAMTHDNEGSFLLFVYPVESKKDSILPTHLMETFVNHTDNAIIVTDAEGYTQWVNPGFTKLSGYEAEEIMGKKPGDLLQGRDTDPETVIRISEDLKCGKRIRTTLLNYHKSGMPYWVMMDINPVLNARGEIEQFVAIELDITYSKRLNLQIQSLQRQYQAMLQTTPNGVFTTDTKGFLNYVNPVLVKKTGIEEKKALKKHSPIVFFDREEVLKMLNTWKEDIFCSNLSIEKFMAYLSESGKIKPELKLSSQNGVPLKGRLNVSKLLDEENRFMGYMGIIEFIETVDKEPEGSEKDRNKELNYFTKKLNHFFPLSIRNLKKMLEQPEMIQGGLIDKRLDQIMEEHQEMAKQLMLHGWKPTVATCDLERLLDEQIEKFSKRRLVKIQRKSTCPSLAIDKDLLSTAIESLLNSLLWDNQTLGTQTEIFSYQEDDKLVIMIKENILPQPMEAGRASREENEGKFKSWHCSQSALDFSNQLIVKLGGSLDWKAVPDDYRAFIIRLPIENTGQPYMRTSDLGSFEVA